MTGSLRIRSPQSAVPTAAAAAPNAPAPTKTADDYLARLVKLIPAEVIALYLGVKGSFNNDPTALAVWGLVCLVLVILVRVVATREPGKPLQLGAVITAAISFIIWIYATGSNIAFLDLLFGWLKQFSSAAVAVWTFIVPFIYKGD